MLSSLSSTEHTPPGKTAEYQTAVEDDKSTDKTQVEPSVDAHTSPHWLLADAFTRNLHIMMTDLYQQDLAQWKAGLYEKIYQVWVAYQYQPVHIILNRTLLAEGLSTDSSTWNAETAIRAERILTALVLRLKKRARLQTSFPGLRPVDLNKITPACDGSLWIDLPASSFQGSEYMFVVRNVTRLKFGGVVFMNADSIRCEDDNGDHCRDQRKTVKGTNCRHVIYVLMHCFTVCEDRVSTVVRLSDCEKYEDKIHDLQAIIGKPNAVHDVTSSQSEGNECVCTMPTTPDFDRHLMVCTVSNCGMRIHRLCYLSSRLKGRKDACFWCRTWRFDWRSTCWILQNEISESCNTYLGIIRYTQPLSHCSYYQPT